MREKQSTKGVEWSRKNFQALENGFPRIGRTDKMYLTRGGGWGEERKGISGERKNLNKRQSQESE